MMNQDSFYDSIISGIPTVFCGKTDHDIKFTIDIEQMKKQIKQQIEELPPPTPEE